MPDDTGGGTEVSTTATGYARIKHGPADASWTVPTTTGIFSNIGVVQFGNPIDDWGTIVGFGLHSAVTGGTLFVYGELDDLVLVENLDPAPAFAEGALTVTFS
jgi:hypothetical protein